VIRLLLVEARRALSRGVTQILVALAVVGIVIAGVLTFALTKDVASQRAEVQAEYDQEMADCLAGSARRPATGPGATRDPRRDCEQDLEYTRSRMDRVGVRLTSLWPGFEPRPRLGNPFFHLLDSGVVMLPGLLLLLGGMVGGASLVGAEWQAGTFVTLLTWEPRRVRLFLARVAVAGVLAALIAVALLALFTLAFYPTAALKGSTAGADGAWWTTYAGVVLRLGGLTALAAMAGAGLAMIGRRTALAIFALVGYLIVGELILGNFWSAVAPWLLLRNTALLLAGDDLVIDGGSALTGALVVAGYTAAVVGVATALFRRRDFVSSG
jgi:ABC-2 type transport system permease protein